MVENLVNSQLPATMEITDSLEDPPAKKLKIELSNSPAEKYKITISVGKNQSLHVWDPKDVIILQSQYRIIGCASGCFAKTPLQNIFQSVPVRITLLEAAYLRDSGVARFVDEAILVQCPSLMEQMVFRTSREKQYFDQGNLFHDRRAERIDAKKDEIIAGKIAKMRAAGDLGSTSEDCELPENKEKLWEDVREDLLSRPMTREGSARIQLPTRSWKIEMGLTEMPECSFLFPETHEEKLLYAAYSALMKAGFWLTSGLKYGGDFLLYDGDVHVNHSICIVKVMCDDTEISLEEVLRVGRVATSCHKAVLWATVSKEYTVDFTCSKWALMK